MHRLQEHLTAHTGVHGYASFQGFAWFVSYSNHGWGNLGIALVDDETGTVLDILIVSYRALKDGACLSAQWVLPSSALLVPEQGVAGSLTTDTPPRQGYSSLFNVY